MSSASKFDLHTAMKNQTTTDDWDVLVSYNANDLNVHLKSAWNNRIESRSIRFTVTEERGPDVYYTDYVMDLGNPVLQFAEGEKSWADLTFDISGSITYREHPDMPINVPRGHYQITCNVPLAGLTGSGDDTRPDGEENYFFDDNTTASFFVTFKFHSKDSVWGFKTVSSIDSATDKAMAATVSNVGDYFKNITAEFMLAICLAEVSNDRHPDASGLLTPESFRLSSQGGKDNSVLCVFIQTKGGRAGKRNPKFNLRSGYDYQPIPDDYGASIIISRDLLINRFLVPEIMKRKDDAHLRDQGGVLEKGGLGPDGEKTGAQFELRYSDDLVTGVKWENYWGLQLVFEGLSINFDDQPLILEIEDDANLQTNYTWKWDCKGTAHYYEVTSGGYISHFNPKYDVKIGPNSTRLASLKDDKIQWDIRFTSNNQPDGTKGDQNIQINLTLYEFDFNLPDLDYFRTTNIFTPGKHVIDAVEMNFPYDLIILGNIAQ